MFKPKIFGKYLIIDKIATGGLGEIYKAKTFEQGGSEKLIAIKTVRPVFADEKDIIELFKSEAVLSESLDHPNVIKVFDHGKIKDKHFIAMEYIHGSDVKIIMKETHAAGTKVPEHVSMYIIREVCTALDYIHHKADPRSGSLSIVHRDISPGNILVSSSGQIKLIDFGVAKTSSKEEEEGTFVGKIRYASPEQVEYKEVDFYSDIFSIGIVLYELLTYKNPFACDKEEDTITAIKEVRFKPLQDYIPHIRPEVDSIIRKSLARNKEDRFSRASAFAEALTEFIASEGIENIEEQFLEFIKSFFESREAKGQVESPEEKEDEKEGTIVTGKKVKEEKQEVPEDDGGTKIVKKKEKDKKELKKVFILHAGFTKILSSDGQEVSRENAGSITNELFRRSMDIIYRYSGSVTELSTKTLAAVIGFPDAHSDDAERSVISAFLLLNELYAFQNELGMTIDLKITIDSGVVEIDRSVKEVGSFSVKGEPVERGRKLLEYARDHVITVTKEVEENSPSTFTFKENGTFECNGKKEPYFEILERRKERRVEKKRFEYKTPFIGRQNDFTYMMKVVSEIKSSYSGHALALLGSVGIGKTRFVRELLQKFSGEKAYYVSAKPELETTFKKNILYGIFAEMVKLVAGIRDSDSDGLIRTKLMNLSQYSLKEHDIHLLGSILGVEFPGSDIQYLEGEERKKELFRALREFIISISKDITHIISIDDTEWMDPGSEEVLKYLLKDIGSLNLFLIYISREKKDTIPNLTLYTLPSLTKDEVIAMLATLLPSIHSVPKLSDEVVLRSGGNPLFIEEISRKLAEIADLTKEDILSTISLPKNLEDIFSVRIDGLKESEKRILEVAACIGRDFRYDILEKAIELDEALESELAFNLDETLARLLEEDLIRINPEKSEPEYVFKHTMLYEAAHNKVEDTEKKNYHRLAGEAIEDLFYDRIDDYYGALVSHFRNAEGFEKVIHYLELVGDGQSKNYANDDALASYRQILEIIETKKERLKLKENVLARKKGVVYQKIASIYQLIGKWEDGMTYADKAIDKAKAISDYELLALSIKTLGRFYKIKGEFDRALQYFTDAQNVADMNNLATARVELIREIGSLYNFKGEFDKALSFIETGLVEAKKLFDDFLIGRFENDRGIILTRKGDLQGSLDALENSVHYKEKINDKYGMGVSLGNIVEIYYAEENYARAREFCEKSIRITEEISDRWGESVNYYNLGNIYFMQDNPNEAKKSFTKSRAIASDINWTQGMLFNDIFLTYFENVSAKSRKKGLQKLEEFLRQALALDAQEGVLKARLFLALLYKKENQKKYAKKIKTLIKDAKEQAIRLNAKDVLKKISEDFK